MGMLLPLTRGLGVLPAAAGGRTFGVRHRHLDYKGRDETPSAQDYNLADYDSPWRYSKAARQAAMLWELTQLLVPPHMDCLQC